MKTKKDIGADFIDKIDNQWYEDSAESHIDAWKSRYSEYKSKKEVEFDLNVNHDSSLETEYAEEILGRKLTTDENDVLIKNFNKAVLKKINLRELRYSF